MTTLKIRIPKPEIITAKDGSCYCWACDHKGLGYRTLGDTPQQAIDDFKNSLININHDSKSGWLNSAYNNKNIVFA